MGYSLVAKTCKGSSDGLTVTTDPIDTSTAKLIVLVLTGTSDTTGGPSDNKSNTWTALTEEVVVGGERVILYYCISPTVGSGHTFTWTPSAGSRPSVAAQAFSHDGTPVFDQENVGGSAFGSSVQPGSVTPSADNCLIVQGIAFNVSGTLSINESYVFAGDSSDYSDKDASNKLGIGAAHLIQTSATATNPTWTHNPGSSSLAAVGAVFKSTGGGITINSFFLVPVAGGFVLAGRP